jgi:hypothetical protein
MSQPKAPRNELEAYMSNPAAHPKKADYSRPSDGFLIAAIWSTSILLVVSFAGWIWALAKCPGAVDLCK